MTNLDYIRQATLQQLVEIAPCPRRFHKTYICPNDCVMCIKSWLESENTGPIKNFWISEKQRARLVTDADEVTYTSNELKKQLFEKVVGENES